MRNSDDPAGRRGPAATLAGDEVHVWLADPDRLALAQLEARYRALLSADECARYHAFYFDKDRRLFLAAHALARLVLARYAGLAPEQVRFVAGPGGKPCAELPGAYADVRHNLSHAAGMAGVVLTRGRECGIDIEGDRPLAALDAVARLACSTDELAQLDTLAGAARTRHLLRLWTLKEAYAKATGEGIGAGLAQVSFRIDGESASCRLGQDDCAGWWFRTMTPAGSHVLALAVAGGPAPVCLHRWQL